MHCPWIAVPLAVAALTAWAPSASATSATVPNSCRWSIDDAYRDLDLSIAGNATPSPAAPGAPVTLTGTTGQARIPDYVAENGYNLGLLKKGVNRIPAAAWLAVEAGDGTQTLAGTVTVTTTIKVDAQQNFVSATPMNVSVPFADSRWTLPPVGALTFAQARAGSLPRLPIGPGGNLRQPLGSAVIQASLSNDVKIALDCQPGRSRPGGATPAAAAPFAVATSTNPGPTPPPVVGPDPSAAPTPALLSTSLRALAGRVGLIVGCAGTGTCSGIAEVRTVAPQRTGRRLAIVTIARGTYTAAGGARRTVRYAVTPAGRALLRRKPVVAVRLQLLSADGKRTVQASRQLTLRR